MRAILLLIAVVLAVAGGCSSPPMMGPTVKVVLDSDPPGGEAYMIPLYEWDSCGAEKMLSDWQRIAKHRVGGDQLTPLEGYPVSHIEQVYLVRKKDPAGGWLYGWRPVVPNEGDPFRVKLERIRHESP